MNLRRGLIRLWLASLGVWEIYWGVLAARLFWNWWTIDRLWDAIAPRVTPVPSIEYRLALPIGMMILPLVAWPVFRWIWRGFDSDRETTGAPLD